MTDIVERLREFAAYGDDARGRILAQLALTEIVRLQTENWQLKQACGYPIPADKETPQNPFKCGICDARTLSSQQRSTTGE